MKLKFTRTDGSILEVEGTVEECSAVAGLTSIGVGATPEIHHHHYHTTITTIPSVPVSPPWPGYPTPYIGDLPPVYPSGPFFVGPNTTTCGPNLSGLAGVYKTREDGSTVMIVSTSDFDRGTIEIPIALNNSTARAQS